MTFPDPELANILIRLDQPEAPIKVQPRIWGKQHPEQLREIHEWVAITAEQVAKILEKPLELPDGRRLVTGVKKRTPWAGYLDSNKIIPPQWMDYGDVKRAYAQILAG